MAIATALDALGIDYVEGGWPGANPTDDAFFDAPPALNNARLIAFGMTRRPGRSAENDPGLAPLLTSKATGLCLVGKAWDFHVDVALEIEKDRERRHDPRVPSRWPRRARTRRCTTPSISSTASRPTPISRWPASPRPTRRARAGWSCATPTAAPCRTRSSEIVAEVTAHVPGSHLGIHAHNDTENAVANSLAAVRAGARQVQGTLNGLGERCGNANLISLIPSLMLKMGFRDRHRRRRARPADRHLAPAGRAAEPAVQPARGLCGRGGLRAQGRPARLRRRQGPAHLRAYRARLVGNQRHIVVSDQAGRSNVLARLDEIGIDLTGREPVIRELVDRVKDMEFKGYAYDGAEASFELLARRVMGEVPDYFKLNRFRIMDDRRWNARGQLVTESEATVTVEVNGAQVMTVANGNGPVNALDTALRKALMPAYPALEDMHLVDYKVRIMPPRADTSGTDAITRVVIESTDSSGERWSTVGVSANVIDASYNALHDAYTWKLFRAARRRLTAGRKALGRAGKADRHRSRWIWPPGAGPAVILVDPQLGENIGMVARAMLNCGLWDLRLVRPRDGWPSPGARGLVGRGAGDRRGAGLRDHRTRRSPTCRWCWPPPRASASRWPRS